MLGDIDVIDLNDNDKLSLLSKSELEELKRQIKGFSLEYRNSLGLDKDVTFGLELEYEYIYKSMVDYYVYSNYSKWVSGRDRSLKSGGEVITDVLIDDEKTWEKLKDICCFLKEKGAGTAEYAGGHVHIGAHILGNEINNWLRFLKVYTVYESVLFRFGRGDKFRFRKHILTYANPIADELFECINLISNDLDNCILDKYLPIRKKGQAINFKNVWFRSNRRVFSNTLEFRFPNATSEEIIWQNNVNAFTKLMLSSQSDRIDEEYLDYKLNNNRVSSVYDFKLYNEINMDKALELVDLIFDNNLDKIYFLKQYLGYLCNAVKQPVRAKRFLRR